MKKILRVSGFNILFFLLGICILELCFGDWIFSENLEQLNLLRNVEYVFNTNKLYKANPGYAVYRRDIYGLRGKKTNSQKIDILTIGGSTTDQRYIGEGETWQDVLESLFYQNGENIDVVNAGLDGQSSFGHIKNFDLWFQKIPHFHPDFILFYIGINDTFCTSVTYYDDLSGTTTLKGMINSKSALYNLFKKIRGMYLANAQYHVNHRNINFQKIAWTTIPLQHDHIQLISKQLQMYESNLKNLSKHIKKLGSTPIFITQTSAMFRKEGTTLLGSTETFEYDNKQLNGVDYYEILSAFNQKTMVVCKDVQGICINLADELLFDTSDFYDYYHNTPVGAHKIGEYLFNKLENFISKNNV